jgi:methyl coenzyme M reductase subunit C
MRNRFGRGDTGKGKEKGKAEKGKITEIYQSDVIMPALLPGQRPPEIMRN